MSYELQNFKDGQTLTHTHLNNIENGILSKQDKLISGINIKTLNGIPLIGGGDISIENGTLVDNSKTIYTDDINNWVRKTISSSGVESTSNITQSNIMYNGFFVTPIYIIPKGNITYAVITYDADGKFISRSDWMNNDMGVQCLNPDNKFTILVATRESNTDLTVEEMLERFILQNFNPDEADSSNIQDVLNSFEKQIEYLTFIKSCDFDGKLAHFSCDDSWECLYDLIQNVDTYNSLFDSQYFKELKDVHDETGACFTLNTFNTETSEPAYDISNVPSKFQSEFQENKAWLRFAFHAENETTRYASATGAEESYKKFVNAIYQLTGDYECIDKITRLGFFSSNLENALIFKNCEHGIIGLLSADDTRTSYYLTPHESEIARLKGKYYDVSNELIFIKTLNRSSSVSLSDYKNNILFQKFGEFFWHEYEKFPSLPTWLKTHAKMCTEIGAIHGFPEDIFKNIE